MKPYLLPIFALLIVGCGTHQPEQTYDEMLNDVVLNFNVGTVGGDSVLKNFVKNLILIPIEEVMLNERKVPAEYINERGNDVHSNL